MAAATMAIGWTTGGMVEEPKFLPMAPIMMANGGATFRMASERLFGQTAPPSQAYGRWDAIATETRQLRSV